MKENDRLTVTVTGYTSDGEGVARADGQVIFIPRAIAGETCRIRIVNVGRSAAHGVIESVEKPSPHRIRPDCPYFGQCGGCDFRHMDYEEELSLKRRRVLDAFARIGGITLPELTITGADTLDGYRNKVQFPVGTRNGAPGAGFFRARTHEVIPADGCKLQPDCDERLKRAVLAWMQAHRIAAYDEKTHTGLVRHIYLRLGAVSGQALCCVVLNAKKTPHPEALVRAVREAVPEAVSIVANYNETRGNSILGAHEEMLYGSGTIEDTLCGLRYRLSPRSFYQIHHDQAERLYAAAVHLADLGREESVLDLYCGAGTITLALSDHAKKVLGAEIVPEAIDDARENAVRNEVKNVEFFCGDASDVAKKLAQEHLRPDVITVDPPRKGLAADVVESIAEMQPERVVYVSCDSATMARDVKRFAELGYTATRAAAVDMFPRADHIEAIVLLSRK